MAEIRVERQKLKKPWVYPGTHCWPPVPLAQGNGGHRPCYRALQGSCDRLFCCVLPVLMGQQAPGICLCLFLPLLSLPSWGHAAVDPSGFPEPLPDLPAVCRAQEGSCIVRSVFLAALAHMTIFSTQQRAGQLGHTQWEGGHWLLTVMLLCQPNQVGLASRGIITVVNSAFHNLSFTKTVMLTIQESSFSLHRIWILLIP